MFIMYVGPTLFFELDPIFELKNWYGAFVLVSSLFPNPNRENISPKGEKDKNSRKGKKEEKEKILQKKEKKIQNYFPYSPIGHGFIGKSKIVSQKKKIPPPLLKES